MPRSDSKDDDKEVVVRTDEGKWPKGVSGNPSGFSADKRKAYKEFVPEMRKRNMMMVIVDYLVAIQE